MQRRQLLAMVGAAGASGLAGCSSSGDGGDGGGDGGDGGGDGGDGGGELGERVPTIKIGYWSDLGGTTALMEDSLPTIQNNLEELGMNIEPNPWTFSRSLEAIGGDVRETPLAMYTTTTNPNRLDPEFMTGRFHVSWAGGNGKMNLAQYANCDYSELAVEQTTVGDRDERHELVSQAQEIFSDDIANIPISPKITMGAVRTDEVDVQALGEGGFTIMNMVAYIKSAPKNGDGYATRVNPAMFQSTNFPVVTNSYALVYWNHLVHSSLIEYDENFEAQNMLAESVETSNEGKTVTVELKDATFHNGDPITSEDVKFTFKHLWDNTSAFPQASQAPYSSIDIIDDKTVEFNLERVYAPLTSKVFLNWGIFHKETWEDADAYENPEEASPSPMIGSGPFQVENFQQGSEVQLTPHDGHPEYSPDHNLRLVNFQDVQAGFRAFQANEIQVIPNTSPTILSRVQDEMDDVAQGTVGAGTMPYALYPQMSWSPGKFREFRDAVGKAIDRQRIIGQAYYGLTEPTMKSSTLLPSHPFGMEEDRYYHFTDNPQGDIDAARSALEDAGWGWDDSGNLRYPADADLSPLWPQGETPSPDDYPCLES